jgi:hypothetical protein
MIGLQTVLVGVLLKQVFIIIAGFMLFGGSILIVCPVAFELTIRRVDPRLIVISSGFLNMLAQGVSALLSYTMGFIFQPRIQLNSILGAHIYILLLISSFTLCFYLEKSYK